MRTAVRKRWWCEHRLCSMSMNILTGQLSRSPGPVAPVIAWGANGANAGSKPIPWPTRPVVERRGVFPPQVRAQVTALACSLPVQTGTPLARWSRTEVARHIASSLEGIAISASTIGRWLRAEKIRPWRYHSWQHIHDPQQFLQRARPVLRLYARAQTLLAKGTWLLSLDEKTSIQARQGEQEPRPALAGKPQLHASRYHRRGARHLFAGLSVADGRVYGTCRTRKCFVDFQAFVQQIIVPEAVRRKVKTVALILDNGTTHAPKQLQGWLAQLEASLPQPLHFQVYWLPPNASWLDQIEIWFSILQRKRLQPNHFRSPEDLERSILDFVASYNQTAKPIKWTYTVDKLERKLGTHF